MTRIVMHNISTEKNWQLHWQHKNTYKHKHRYSLIDLFTKSHPIEDSRAIQIYYFCQIVTISEVPGVKEKLSKAYKSKVVQLLY